MARSQRRNQASVARTTWEDVCRFAVALPEAYEDHPWGELVVKVNKKVFVFLGMGGESPPGTPTTEQAPAGGPRPPGMCVKLAESLEAALGLEGAEPAGYGLGRHGWVNLFFAEDSPEVGLLTDWVEESYRLVAPKRLVKLLVAPGRCGCC